MANEQVDYSAQLNTEFNLKLRDIEGKNRILKDRVSLIGQNLIEIKENTSVKILDIKKDIEIMKREIEKISLFLENLSSEISKFAKKEDLEILTKQARMFQPMEFVTKKEFEDFVNQKN